MFGLNSTVFCGPMKSGTTWIHAYLKARDDVCLPARTKEIFFFDRYYGRGAKWYRSQFRPEKHHRILVDVAPSIMVHPDAPTRVAKTLQDAEVVLMRRDPVARAWSHYLHLKRYGYTSAPLAEAIETHPVIFEASRIDYWRDQWRMTFGNERVHVLDAELLFRDAEAFRRKLDGLLGLPASSVDLARIRGVNRAALPRSYLVSKMARKVSYALRDAGMDAVVHAARDMGWNRIYADRRQSRPAPKPTEADLALIKAKIAQSGSLG